MNNAPLVRGTRMKSGGYRNVSSPVPIENRPGPTMIANAVRGERTSAVAVRC